MYWNKFIITVTVFLIGKVGFGQIGWTQKANFLGTPRTLVAEFAINNYGYIGCGYDGSYLNDFYRWNQITNTWSQIANYPGQGSWSPTHFSMGGYGYVGLGQTSFNTMATDLWRYDPLLNTWTAMASFPALGLYDASCFVIGEKCWVVCGSNGGPPYNPSVWMYNGVTNTWTQKSNFPGGQLEGLLTFSIGKTGYAGAGWDGSNYHNAMYRYDTGTDTWTPIAPVPARLNGLCGCPRSFVIGTKAYVCAGRDGTGKSMPLGLIYDTVTASWCKFSKLGRIARSYGAAFAINDTGYIGVGADSTGTFSGPFLNDFWQYSPTSSFLISDTIACGNDTVHFTGITTYDSTDMSVNWNWSFAGGNPASSNSQYPTVVYSTSGTYMVQAIITSCAGTDTVKRNIHVTAGALTITMNGDTAICKGSNTILTATGGGTYRWNNGATSGSINVTPNNTTTYTVVVHNGTCTDSASITVDVYNTPTITVSPNRNICTGDTAVLYATGGGNYLWNTGATTSAITVTPNGTATYTVVVRNGRCSDSGTVKVTVNTLAVTINPNITICKGDSVTLNAGGGGTYSWSNGATTSSITVTPAATTTFTIGITNGSCSKDTAVTVTVANRTAATISKPQTICAGEQVTITATGGGTYKWSNGATTSSITITPSNDTVLSVIVSAGCPDTVQTTVTLKNLSLYAGRDTTIIPGDSAQLSASGIGDTGFIWTPEYGLSCISCPDPIATPSVTTTYTVTASDSSGCTSQRTVTITVVKLCNDLYVPNVFTPNNDGINDDFVVSVDSLYPSREPSSWANFTSYSIIIYDRWGKEVFISTDPTMPWNGRVLNTQDLVPDGVYYYILKATCSKGEFDRKGFVEVLGEK